MSAKSLAPIALGIGALYLFSTKGSPFAQQPRKPGAKPGGEHVGPPKPETETPNSKAKTPKPPTLKDLKKRDAGLRKLAGLTLRGCSGVSLAAQRQGEPVEGLS